MLALGYLAGFDSVAGRDRIQRPISRIQTTCLLEQSRCFEPITSLLHDFAFQCVQINQSRRVFNCAIAVFEGVFVVAEERVVVGDEVEEPEVDRGILLLVVCLVQRSLLGHRCQILQKKTFDLSDFCIVLVELFKGLND